MDLSGLVPPANCTTAPLVGFDIETDTASGGLDPETAAVVATAVSTDSCDEVFTGDEAELLAKTDHFLSTIPTGYLVTWNGSTFDLPFVARRAELLGIDLGLELSDDPSRGSRHEPDRRAVRGRWHNLVQLDGYVLYRADVGRSLGLSCGLKPLARLVGMDPVELDREALHLASAEEVDAYVASDARTAAELVRRRMPAAALAADHLLAAVHPASTTGTGNPPRAARD